LDGDFQNRLLSGERVLWQGQPVAGIMFTVADVFLVPFSLLWGGFAFFWEWSVTRTDGAPIFFSLWGVPFVLAGLYLIVGRFFIDAWIRGRTYYAVTNRRILILRTGPFSKFTALAIDRLPELSLDEKATGIGTIRFQSTPGWPYSRNFSGWSPALDSSQFLAIPGARNVFDQIQKLATKPS
jgi:hypothetical protein